MKRGEQVWPHLVVLTPQLGIITMKESMEGLMEKMQRYVKERKGAMNVGAAQAGGAFCYGAASEVLRFGLGPSDEQKNPFPSAQTVVSVSVSEGLGIDLNYLDCLEKSSEGEADLKSCYKQHTSRILLFP